MIIYNVWTGEYGNSTRAENSERALRIRQEVKVCTV